MNNTIFKSVKDELSEKRRRAQAEAEERRMEIYSLIPEVKQYDFDMISLVRALIGAGDRAQAILDKIEELTQKRTEALSRAGYPADYTNPKYECRICNDTGYDGTKMCSCLKRKLQLETLRASGLGKLAEAQSFDSFSLDFYTGQNRALAERAINTLKSYSESFSEKTSESFLLLGGTGLGKTHLSTAVAKAVIERNFYVVYTSAVRMFEDFEKKRFNSNSIENEHLTDRYYDSDLLILDDLGSELSTQFTVSALYALVNTRLNEEKPIIISTNLTPEEFQKKYDSRITSRILGNMTVLLFRGDDVRRQRLNRK